MLTVSHLCTLSFSLFLRMRACIELATSGPRGALPIRSRMGAVLRGGRCSLLRIRYIPDARFTFHFRLVFPLSEYAVRPRHGYLFLLPPVTAHYRPSQNLLASGHYRLASFSRNDQAQSLQRSERPMIRGYPIYLHLRQKAMWPGLDRLKHPVSRKPARRGGSARSS